MISRQLRVLPIVLLWAFAVAAQPAGESVSEPVILEEDLGEDIETLLAEAEEVFRSPDQPESIPLFERIVLSLERQRQETALDEQGEEWLVLALFRRAEARFNLLETESAADDLRAILRLDANWQVPAGYSISSRLAKLLAEIRDAETGILDPIIEPVEAQLSLDGEPLPRLDGPRRVLAGERLLAVTMPGYAPFEQQLTIAPGETVPIEVALERTSAVVRLTTLPAGVEVVAGGEPLAVSQPAKGGVEEGLSAELAVGGLQPGARTLTLRKPGYRTLEVPLEIEGLEDYTLGSITLEPSRGTVVISGLPETARLRLDGAALPASGGAELRLELPPGSHELRVEAGAAGLFERQFELADRQLLEIEARLRPALVLLGVLGGDREAGGELERRLAERLGALEQWALAPETERGFDLLREAAIDQRLLRRLAGDPDTAEAPDWTALQKTLDDGLGGSAYLLGVLSDDLYASRADLWLWSAAPGPSRPARRRIELADGAGIEQLAEALDRPLRLATAHLGARLVDSPIGQSPLVLSVEPGGPAAAAGLAAGDRIDAAGGEPVTTAGELLARLAALGPGAEVELGVSAAGDARRVEVTLGSSARVEALTDPMALDPALAALLASLEAGESSAAPGWLLRLNRGVVLMRSGELKRAAAALRGVRAPERAGVGQGTVDYLLGIALLEVDAATYREPARQLIGQAAAAGARLEHDDGPLVAPRARARLELPLVE